MYFKNKYISESQKLISDVIKIAKVKKLEDFLVAMNMEKVIINKSVLIFTTEKYGFGKNLCYG